MSKSAKILIVAISALALALPLASMAGPDGNQQMAIQQIQQAKQKLAAAEAAQGAERQKLMQEHMNIMDQVLTQMQKAKPGTNMTPEQMRDWIDEHMKLMNDMMGQMMAEHHMMMQGTSMSGMMKK
jgi:predicted PurR-regulated permease PerM